MREIKFRFWDIERKKFTNEYHLIDKDDGLPCKVCYDAEIETSNHNGDDIKINQFTGLKDKKGVEIYESDIIKTKIGVMDFVLKVIFENGKFMAVGDDDLTAFDLFTIADKCEVIGNIYENKERLK